MTLVKKKLKILFLCTGNSCRSQMAEGWAKKLKVEEVEAYSAGTDPQGVNPLAVKVMAEAGVDIRGQESKHIDVMNDKSIDYVITLCNSANAQCPSFTGPSKRLHVEFDDPPVLAKTASSESEVLNHYRRVRDEIKAFVQTLPGSLE